jgi:predicted homoserine dehydrogenase-like protein
MNLYTQLQQRAASGHPVRVGLIGAGKFGGMFLSQAPRTPGIHVLGITDLSAARVHASLERVGWEAERYSAASFDEAVKNGTTFIQEDPEALIFRPELDVVIDATGIPAAGIHHALLACQHRKHIVMVNVEADVLAGPLLSRKAQEAGIVYSMAYGDQPALIAEMVDWARTTGFEVVCAGKGTKYLPEYHQSTPDTVWGHYGFSEEQVASGDFNARMFNSFLDGTKSALEMAAVANATGLDCPKRGLAFPPCGVDDLPTVLRPCADGGVLPQKGMVEVVSSLERDGRPVPRDLRWGVYVVIEAPSDYVRSCFLQYGLKTDATGRYTATYKPYHLIGFELAISVASAALRGEPTGATREFRGDAVATAKRVLRAGETLDGEGGFTVYGTLIPAADSLELDALPIGVAHGMTLRNEMEPGQIVKWSDVAFDEANEAIRVRREMETMFRTYQGFERATEIPRTSLGHLPETAQ